MAGSRGDARQRARDEPRLALVAVLYDEALRRGSRAVAQDVRVELEKRIGPYTLSQVEEAHRPVAGLRISVQDDAWQSRWACLGRGTAACTTIPIAARAAVTHDDECSARYLAPTPTSWRRTTRHSRHREAARGKPPSPWPITRPGADASREGAARLRGRTATFPTRFRPCTAPHFSGVERRPPAWGSRGSDGSGCGVRDGEKFKLMEEQ